MCSCTEACRRSFQTVAYFSSEITAGEARAFAARLGPGPLSAESPPGPPSTALRPPARPGPVDWVCSPTDAQGGSTIAILFPLLPFCKSRCKTQQVHLKL